MYPTIKSLTPDCTSIYYSSFHSSASNYISQLFTGRRDLSKSIRAPQLIINPLSGLSCNFTTRFNLETCTAEKNLYGAPEISYEPSEPTQSSATRNGLCRKCASLRAYPSLTFSEKSRTCVKTYIMKIVICIISILSISDRDLGLLIDRRYSSLVLTLKLVSPSPWLPTPCLSASQC